MQRRPVLALAGERLGRQQRQLGVGAGPRAERGRDVGLQRERRQATARVPQPVLGAEIEVGLARLVCAAQRVGQRQLQLEALQRADLGGRAQLDESSPWRSRSQLVLSSTVAWPRSIGEASSIVIGWRSSGWSASPAAAEPAGEKREQGEGQEAGLARIMPLLYVDPDSLHTSRSAPTSRSIAASSCSGEGVMRSRSVPRGTVGKLIGWM